MKRKSIEAKAADTMLQRPINVKIGDTEYRVAPPTIGTLVRVSELIEDLPAYEPEEGKENLWVLKTAREWRNLPLIYAVLILGNTHADDEVIVSRKGILRRKVTRKAAYVLAQEIEDRLSPSELLTGTTELMKSLELADFFVLTTFLTGIKMTKPTKVEKTPTQTTASGR